MELWVVCTIITKIDGTQRINIGFLNIQRKGKKGRKKVNVLAVTVPLLTRHYILSNQSCFAKRAPLKSWSWWINSHSGFMSLSDLLLPPMHLRLRNPQWFSKSQMVLILQRGDDHDILLEQHVYKFCSIFFTSKLISLYKK